MYTLVAYKPSSEDSCRGVTMGVFHSDFYLGVDLDKNALTKKLAEFIQKDKMKSGWDSELEFYIFRKGILIWEKNYFTRGYFYTNCEDPKATMEEEAVLQEISEIFEKARKLNA